MASDYLFRVEIEKTCRCGQPAICVIVLAEDAEEAGQTEVTVAFFCDLCARKTDAEFEAASGAIPQA